MDSNPPRGDEQPVSHFLSLPTELIIAIVARLANDYPTLCRLAQTCAYLKPLAEEHIYSTIKLRHTEDLQDIIFAFAQEPARVAAVKSLQIVYKHHDALSTTLEERREFNKYVKHMKLLKDWHVESPYDNNDWEDGGFEWVQEDMQEFRRSLEDAALHEGQSLRKDIGLAKLEKLILHSHGLDTDYWELNDFHCLFRHPTLRFLHISCVDLSSDIPELEPFQRQTPLTTLIFDECELEPQSLGQILSTPKSLKRLTLGENVHNQKNRRRIRPRLTNNPKEALEALSKVSHSLEDLTHIDPKFKTVNDQNDLAALPLPGQGMRDFHKLTSIECDPCSFLHRGIIMNHLLAPPNLSTLRMHDPHNHVFEPSKLGDTFWDKLPDYTPYIQLPSLKLIEFTEPTISQIVMRLADYIGDFDRTRLRHAYAYKLWKHGIQMKLYANVHSTVSLIPPYLFGEATPVRLCLYDSEKVGFQRVIRDEDDLGPIITRAVPVEGSSNEFELRILPESEKEDNDDRRRKKRRTRSSSSSVEEEEQLPETDQLSKRDVARLRNEIWRIFQTHRSQITRARQQPTTLWGGQIPPPVAGGGVILELLTDVSEDEWDDESDGLSGVPSDWEQDDDFDDGFDEEDIGVDAHPHGEDADLAVEVENLEEEYVLGSAVDPTELFLSMAWQEIQDGLHQHQPENLE